jgi:predicted MPP superfamily phosphohydrolase
MKNMKKIRIGFILIVVVAIIIYLFVQNTYIQVESIEIFGENLPSELDGFKIVQLSDLHLPQRDGFIQNIVALTAEQNPNVIVLTGDLVDSKADVPESGLKEFAELLTPIADVYAIYGNHEEWGGQLEEWETSLVSAGVHVLGREGMLPLHGYDIWLDHYPGEWNDGKVDLVFSGHAHGGQFRIPFVGGVVAPDQGFFPKFTSGVYPLSQGTDLVVSRGLGNSLIPIRINNRPHIPVVTLRKGS